VQDTSIANGEAPFVYYFKCDNETWTLLITSSNLYSHSHAYTSASIDTNKIDLNDLDSNVITRMSQITNDRKRYTNLLDWCSKHRSARRQEIKAEIKDRFGVAQISYIALDNMCKKLRIESGAGGRSPGEDFSAFIKTMIDDSQVDGAYWQFDSDPETNQMTRFMYQSVDMQQAWRRCSQFLAMDCTCKTNIYNCPLFLIIGVDENNVSVILAWALLKSESSESFAWVFDQLRTVMGDDAITMVNTVATNGCVRHVNRQRCMWHLLHNLKDKCAGYAVHHLHW